MAAWNPIDADVTFKDGRTERVRLSMRARLEVERRWPGLTSDDDGRMVMRNAPGMEAAFFAAWWTLVSPKAFDQFDFDQWVDTVESLVEIAPEADPSQPAPGDDE